MNKTIAALAVTLLLAGCQQEQKENQSAQSADDKAAVTTQKSEASSGDLAEKNKIAYAIGANMADSISGISAEYKALTMDMEVVTQGFSDRLNKQSKLTDEEIAQQMQIFQQKMRYAQQQKMQRDQMDKDTENKAYLAENLTKGFTQTESGLQYKVITAAKDGAANPSATDKVRVTYKGTFTDGREFDSSDSFNFSLAGGVIKGWLEGVKLMSIGSKFEFVIPPELAYGSRASGPIPAGSILKFDIELLEIVKSDSTSKK